MAQSRRQEINREENRQDSNRTLNAQPKGNRTAEEIARLAYQLYEERGRQDGHDVDDWLKAEAAFGKKGQAAT